MAEEFFIYHFNGGNGLSGAFTAAGDSGEAGVNTEYGYLVNDEEIPALQDHLIHRVELEGGVSSARRVDGDTYEVLKGSEEEIASQVEEEFDFGQLEGYDLRNILRTPVEGYAPGQDISFGPHGEEELRRSARKGHVEGQRERIRNNRTKDNRTKEIDFYTNTLERDEVEGLEEFIRSL